MKKFILINIPFVILAFVAGMFLSGSAKLKPTGIIESVEGIGGEVSFYTCSMHPTVKLQDAKAKCPICAMDLIPVTSRSDENSESTTLFLSPRALKLAEIETTLVERKFVETEIRMVGKVEYDETRLSYITAWVPGRLDRLYVDYTGVAVNKGDHLVDLYSPDLLSAQEELLQAIQSAQSLVESDSEFLRSKSLANIESTKKKLRLWGLSEDQIKSIEMNGNSSDRITINSPISGIVVHKDALEGMYVKTGTQVYTIADLSKVWVKLDAYESDLPWLHYGQQVEFRTEAYPGQVFSGQIAFIDPILNANTRTVKIRVNLPNPDGKLKPDMFVRATVKSSVAKGGRVMNPDLMGKWISPMHPEIVKNAPGSCDICGMDLVSAESMGYVSADHLEDEAPLVIPVSAPLITGKRSVVYVSTGDGHFEGRVVELGPRAGNHYIVFEGLTEGERVVSRGSFKIDSAVQIQAKPSMMNPGMGESFSSNTDHSTHIHMESEKSHGDLNSSNLQIFEVPETFTQSLQFIINDYLTLQDALSHDRIENVQSFIESMRQKLDSMEDIALSQHALSDWEAYLILFKEALSHMDNASDILILREGFLKLSNVVIPALKQFGKELDQDIFVYHCPMAFKGRGGDWIQAKSGIENPYFGSSMFTCGELKEHLHE